MEENDKNRAMRLMDLLYINNLKHTIEYTLDNLRTLETLDIRNRLTIMVKLIEQTQNELSK